VKIGIDISQIVYRTGVSRYTEELVKSLLKIDQENQYVFFGSSLRRRKELNSFVRNVKSKNTYSAIYPLPPSFLEFLLNRVRIYDIRNFIGKVDVFHSSDWTQPKTTAAKVTTVHDLGVFKFPELFHSKIVEVQKRRLNLVKKECDKIIAVSQNTKKDLIEILGIPENKIRVIYEAASEHFKPQKKEEVEKVKGKFGIRNNYILTVATFGARKNLIKLYGSFKKIRKNYNLDLVIVGSGIEAERNIISTGFVKDLELASLYSGAMVFIYPSKYEGFGLPVLEAMSCGSPVICSETSSLPEVGGKCVIYADPDSEEEMTESLEKIIDDEKEQERLVKLGYLQSKKFSWQATAEKTLEIYRSLI
jgi:glycosyltransferase involved in cell wall biosynthesis